VGGEDEPYPSWELVGFESVAYRPKDRERIHQGLASGGPRDLALLHTWLGDRFAEAVLAFLHARDIPENTIGAIGSHGQTIWHEPPNGDQRGTSLQLGCPATLAERTGIGVVSDFRSRDLAAGGHGAPLVPWADRVLFSSDSEVRAIQNLGGMGNVTWLPKRGGAEPLVAFDTGPGVALLDGAAELATGGRQTFDRDGALARRGTVNQALLDRLLEHPFFRLPPPRSTGRETFGRPFLEDLIETLEGEGWALVPGSESSSWCDVLATLVALTARSIGDAYREWLPAGDGCPVYLTGGGARNPTLAEAITREIDPRPTRPAEELGLDPDAREAAAFALLAWAHVHGIPANVPGATGSSGPRVLGSWTPGKGGHS
jgi:anhydro-N-acetylmuramic acid kinase